MNSKESPYLSTIAHGFPSTSQNSFTSSLTHSSISHEVTDRGSLSKMSFARDTTWCWQRFSADVPAMESTKTHESIRRACLMRAHPTARGESGFFLPESTFRLSNAAMHSRPERSLFGLSALASEAPSRSLPTTQSFSKKKPSSK